jgi:hypothetical protein
MQHFTAFSPNLRNPEKRGDEFCLFASTFPLNGLRGGQRIIHRLQKGNRFTQ